MGSHGSLFSLFLLAPSYINGSLEREGRERERGERKDDDG